MDITEKEIQNYMRTHQVRAPKVLSILGKNKQLINALSTPVGKELLKIPLERAENSLSELLLMDIDSSKEKFLEVRARYRECAALIQEYLNVMTTFEQLTEEVKKN